MNYILQGHPGERRLKEEEGGRDGKGECEARGGKGQHRNTKVHKSHDRKGEKPGDKSLGVSIGLLSLSIKPALQNGAALKENLQLLEAASTLQLHEEAGANAPSNTNRSPTPP